MSGGLLEFKEMLEKYRYDYDKLVYILFPFGEEGHEMEHMRPWSWQLKEWRLMSEHFKDPLKKDIPYKLCISSGNGIGKSMFFSVTLLMLLYTQKTRARITANTYNQIKNITWVELDNWCRRARFFDIFFEKLGESIKSRDEKMAETWRADLFTWDENNPTAISGLHNKNGCIFLGIDEAAAIPNVITQYLNGAMTDTDTMKVWLMIGNSDDPESSFENKMADPNWRSSRIDSRTVEGVSKDFIKSLLDECGGDEDHDDFRVRVRGLPRKSSKDSIISAGRVQTALNSKVDRQMMRTLPVILTCDPAWTGGDMTTIWVHQGNWSCLLDVYRLNKEEGQTHLYSYQRLCMWEREYQADAVLIDQGEGTAIYTLAQAANKYNWELISFGSSPNDAPESKDSQYHNMRAQMYYEAEKWLSKGGVLEARLPEWTEQIAKELCWTKGTRHKTSLKKMAEPKDDIKKRVGKSPDISDGFVLRFSRVIYDRLPEHYTEDEREVFELNDNTYKADYNPYFS